MKDSGLPPTQHISVSNVIAFLIVPHTGPECTTMVVGSFTVTDEAVLVVNVLAVEASMAESLAALCV
ncbi:unnamed protein product [Taenia asiatica]|uniref:Uncharacterized protein n=1 Tax=Taenia asiatica TaxID=60517 RepID=A0A0R3WH17_TAEAS|nr:unnamed protein product [Taenia asiatica]